MYIQDLEKTLTSKKLHDMRSDFIKDDLLRYVNSKATASTR